MFKRKSKITVNVTTMDAELEFAILQSTTGKQLFDQVVKTIGLREIWYFGLQFVDSKGEDNWLQLHKKVMSQDIRDRKDSSTPLQFKFRVKFYPEDVTEELIQDVTLRLFYLQVKDQILETKIFCPAETCVLLASYAVQVKFGDYSTAKDNENYMGREKLLPERVYNQYDLSREEWEIRIRDWHKEHAGFARDDAKREYLKLAQDLEMYGVNYFEITNKKGTQLYLGVDALGLNVYNNSDKLTPKIGFPWSEIKNISFTDKRFTIKPIDKKAPDFIFYSARLRTNKRIMQLVMGNHELYMRRRRTDSIEVQQMKLQQQEARRMKEEDKLLLERQKAAAIAAEEERNVLQEKLESLEKQSKVAKNDLERQRDEAEELQRRRHVIEEERIQLEKERKEAEEAKKMLDERAKLEAEEKQRLIQVAEEAKLIAAKKAEEAREKDEEAQRLLAELEETNNQMKMNQERMINLGEQAMNHVQEQSRKEQEIKQHYNTTTTIASNHHHHHHPMENNRNNENSLNNNHHNNNNFDYNNNQPNRIEMVDTRMSGLHVKDGYDEESNNENLINAPRESDVVPQPELQRSHNKRHHNLLSELKTDLDSKRNTTKMSITDKQHEENVQQGRDKYKTLKQIRVGNTKKRIDEFESM
ncbi:hypothetical protein SNEBB_010836 [Seison nebaliae]|nr:hypothetical protein SNEBB_010836 [Seison nebaliae]